MLKVITTYYPTWDEDSKEVLVPDEVIAVNPRFVVMVGDLTRAGVSLGVYEHHEGFCELELSNGRRYIVKGHPGDVAAQLED